MTPIGSPHTRLGEAGSTNDMAREAAAAGAPHGATFSAERQTASKGRQGRAWSTPEGAIAVSVVVRDGVDRLLPLRAGLAVAQLAGPAARVKWPNDVLVGGRKVAGILVETEGDAAIVGIGVNAAVDLAELPEEVRARAGTLGLAAGEVPAALDRLLELLDAAVRLPAADVVAALSARDALVGQTVRWSGGEGTAAGIGPDGRLLVRTADGDVRLDGGEVHLL